MQSTMRRRTQFAIFLIFAYFIRRSNAGFFTNQLSEELFEQLPQSFEDDFRDVFPQFFPSTSPSITPSPSSSASVSPSESSSPSLSMTPTISPSASSSKSTFPTPSRTSTPEPSTSPKPSMSMEPSTTSAPTSNSSPSASSSESNSPSSSPKTGGENQDMTTSPTVPSPTGSLSSIPSSSSSEVPSSSFEPSVSARATTLASSSSTPSVRTSSKASTSTTPSVSSSPSTSKIPSSSTSATASRSSIPSVSSSVTASISMIPSASRSVTASASSVPSFTSSTSASPSVILSVSISVTASTSTFPSISSSVSASASSIPSSTRSTSVSPSSIPSSTSSTSVSPSSIPSSTSSTSVSPSSIPSSTSSTSVSPSSIPSSTSSTSVSPSSIPSASSSASVSTSSSSTPSVSSSTTTTPTSIPTSSSSMTPTSSSSHSASISPSASSSSAPSPSSSVTATSSSVPSVSMSPTASRSTTPSTSISASVSPNPTSSVSSSASLTPPPTNSPSSELFCSWKGVPITPGVSQEFDTNGNCRFFTTVPNDAKNYYLNLHCTGDPFYFVEFNEDPNSVCYTYEGYEPCYGSLTDVRQIDVVVSETEDQSSECALSLEFNSYRLGERCTEESALVTTGELSPFFSNNQCRYHAFVPDYAKRYNLSISCEGDPGIYVGFDRVPDTSDYDCYTFDGYEQCASTTNGINVLNILISPFQERFSNCIMNIEFSEVGECSAETTLLPAVGIELYHSAYTHDCPFYIDVPENVNYYEVDLVCSKEHAYLHVMLDNIADPYNYFDCYGLPCSGNTYNARRIHVILESPWEDSECFLQVSFEYKPSPTPSPSVIPPSGTSCPAESVFAPIGETKDFFSYNQCMFHTDVPADAQEYRVDLKCRGDPDLYISYDSDADFSGYHCSSHAIANVNNFCSGTISGIEKISIFAPAYGLMADCTLNIDFFSTPTICSATSFPVDSGMVMGFSSTDDCLFHMDLPPMEVEYYVDIECTGDPDLYIGYDRTPSLSTYDCISDFEEGTTDSCYGILSGINRVYIMVHPFSAISECTLYISYNEPWGAMEVASISGGVSSNRAKNPANHQLHRYTAEQRKAMKTPPQENSPVMGTQQVKVKKQNAPTRKFKKRQPSRPSSKE